MIDLCKALSIAGTAVGVTVAFCCLLVLYNLFLHPLRKYPGPFLCRATRFVYIYRLLEGYLPRYVEQWHQQYGPVVRIAPNELSFAAPAAWKDIYSGLPNKPGVDRMGKDEQFYVTPFLKRGIFEATTEKHVPLRKNLARGFSDGAMRQQEPMIRGYVDLLIQRLREHCVEERYVDEEGEDKEGEKSEKPKKATTTPKALDMCVWYNWTTFDIIGDLAFGEPFQCLEKAAYHPWVLDIANMVETLGLFLAAKVLHLGYPMMMAFGLLMPGQKEMLRLSESKVRRRAALTVDRPDLLEGLVKGRDLHLDIPHLAANASFLVLAGSETTATLLSGVTYLLLKNPAVLARLTAEVRSSFAADEEITLLSVNNLAYMLAVLNEGMRCYPPVPYGMPRVVPKGGAVVAGDMVPGGAIVGCWQWALNHLPENWDEPYAFKPERFLDEGKNEGDRFEAMQPFSIGPRNCIGRNLAYAEMRLILARVLYNFDLQLADPNLDWLKGQKGNILWEKPKLKVILTPVSK